VSVRGPSRPRIGVLAVQGAVAEHAAALGPVGAEAVEVRRPEELDGLDGLVIPGGESTTFGLVAERTGLLGALRRVVIEERLPTFGTCAGMIMLAAEALGGAPPLVGGMALGVRRNAWGRQVASFEAPLDVPAIGPEPLEAVFIRAPWVEWTGPGVEVLATHGGHGVAARQEHMLVTAFHPELTDDLRLHALFVEGARGGRRSRRDDEGEGARVRA
jgi:5'-phosphate synthase pdxT subunit